MADVGAGVEQCFIVKQKGTKTFIAEAVSDGTQAKIRLVNTPGEVTGIGFGYMEAGGAGSNKEAEGATVVAGGTLYVDGNVLTVVGGTGTAATLTVQETGGIVDAVVVTTGGDYSVLPTNPVSVTGGGGTLATFDLVFNSTDDVYVAKLSNKNLIVVGGRRETYTINAEGTADRDVSGA